jgi:adenosylmethionine-8-amino-7-oxononanoate aminotransferase
MTGWGRTGTRFACEQADVTPDIACYSKGLTGGSLPLAVTLCRADIFEAHYSTDRGKTFFHSSSYTANPIACAAACANLEIWQNEPVIERVAAVARAHTRGLDRFRENRRFANLRQIGAIAALDIVTDDPGYLAGIGLRLYDDFLRRGLLIRPLGNTIYLMPPYCSTQQELDCVFDAIGEIVDGIG